MRNIILFLSLTIGFSISWAASESLKPFETDNCTFFAEGTIKQPDQWKHCCFEHDLRYWFGGSIPDRDFADENLKQCVKDVAGPFWSQLIYRGVKAGHQSPAQHRLHWAWGWTSPRDNHPLSSSEKEIIQHDLHQLRLNRAYVDDFISKYRLN